MGNENSIYVGNDSDKTIMVRVNQERTVIKDLDVGLSAGATKVDASMKAKFDHQLSIEGYSRIGPKEVLEHNVSRWKSEAYVSVTTADDPEPLIICVNFSPPKNRPVLISKNLTPTLADKSRTMEIRASSFECDDGGQGPADGQMQMETVETIEWVTDDGTTYNKDMMFKIHKTGD